jgi:peptidoglycan/xylan/chitin deacetylase (PgdA/CDA1 family)
VKPVILCYHAVAERGRHRLAIPPELLERQLKSVLARRYAGATAAQALAGRGRLLHVTFDDAYRNVEAALPLLRRLRLPVTVFACTAFADGGLPLDIPELHDDVLRDPGPLTTMPWERLRALVDEGVEIGSHTRTHPHLVRLSDAELQRELAQSKQELEDELGRPCPYVAYPYGDVDERVAAAARAAGYDAGFALGPRPRGDRFMVPRTDLYTPDGVVRTIVKTTPLWTAAATAARLARVTRRRA